MRLLNLLTNTNRWEDSVMNLKKSFNSIQKHDHSASFDGLGPWLDQQSKRPKPMKNFYKVAASLVATALILVACTVPVQQEEEIGYMIKGLTTDSPIDGKSKISGLSELSLEEVQFHQVIHLTEYADEDVSERQNLTEVVMLLPEANITAAEEKVAALESVLSFTNIDILPIEDTVERTIFESAMHKTFDVKINPELSEAKVAERINIFLHENSSITEQVDVELDENGNRKAVFRIKLDPMGEGATYEVKRDIEQLYQDLTPERNESNLEEIDVNELKELEIKKVEEERQKRDNQ